jgi:hypothetical protein
MLLLARLLRIPMVWLELHDGEVRLSRVKHSAFGKYLAKSILSYSVILHTDGTTSGCCYINYWKAANKMAESLRWKMEPPRQTPSADTLERLFADLA